MPSSYYFALARSLFPNSMDYLSFIINVMVLLFQLTNLPASVKIVEVGPRDGLQNEKVGDALIVFEPLNQWSH